jgi:hypothetical protein
VLAVVAAEASPGAPKSEIRNRAAEKRGRQIYFTGASASGRPITAILAGETELPASSLPCGSCHGPDGRGVPEGTIEPADIRWSTLSQPRKTGRLRLRYDDALLHQAIATGVDAGGNALSAVMPRYRMHEGDLADLLAYLRRLGDPVQPGLSETEIVVAAAPSAQVGAVTRSVIEACFKDVNASGGIFGRTLRLDGATTVDPERVFAALCTPAVEVDPLERMPLVTPFPSAAADAELPAAFFLYPDLRTQALALAKSVTSGARVYVVSDGSAAAGDAASAVTEAVDAVALAPDLRLAAPVQPRDTDFLFFIGRVDAPALLRRLDERQWRPRLLVAGGNVGDLRDARSEVLFAVPTLPGDVTPEAHEELEAFTVRHRLSRTQLATQIASYATVKVFVEGLKRAGRELTREKLIAALEQLYDFPTGLTPPLTFGRNRHIGSAGAYVVSPDLRYRSFVRVGGGDLGGRGR